MGAQISNPKRHRRTCASNTIRMDPANMPCLGDPRLCFTGLLRKHPTREHRLGHSLLRHRLLASRIRSRKGLRHSGSPTRLQSRIRNLERPTRPHRMRCPQSPQRRRRPPPRFHPRRAIPQRTPRFIRQFTKHPTIRHDSGRIRRRKTKVVSPLILARTLRE